MKLVRWWSSEGSKVWKSLVKIRQDQTQKTIRVPEFQITYGHSILAEFFGKIYEFFPKLTSGVCREGFSVLIESYWCVDRCAEHCPHWPLNTKFLVLSCRCFNFSELIVIKVLRSEVFVLYWLSNRLDDRWFKCFSPGRCHGDKEKLRLILNTEAKNRFVVSS